MMKQIASRRPLWAGLVLTVASVLAQSGMEVLVGPQSTTAMASIPPSIISMLGGMISVAQMAGVVLVSIHLYFALARQREPLAHQSESSL